MPKRLLYGLYAVLFIVSVTLIVWQGSFSGSFGSFAPDDPDQTIVVYGVSTIIFLVFVYLGFMLMRLIWKIWMERASDRPGSRIKTKLVAGALMLSVMPVFFMVLFSVYVLNNSIGKWFNLPAEHERVDFDRIAEALKRQTTKHMQKRSFWPPPPRQSCCWPGALPTRRGLRNSASPEG
jgi:two-component system nitrogen regulation sensor histidine kinase NtrY